MGTRRRDDDAQNKTINRHTKSSLFITQATLTMSIAQLGSTTAVNTRSLAGKNFIGSKVSSVTNGSKGQMSRWKGMDEDISDDQQDISRGRDMVDSKFQGGYGMGGTQTPSCPPRTTSPKVKRTWTTCPLMVITITSPRPFWIRPPCTSRRTLWTCRRSRFR